MESTLQDIRSKRNSKARVKIMHGHFATPHSHVNTYIDVSTVKSRHNNARETARELAKDYREIMVEGILALEGTEVIAAFMAEELSQNGIMNINRGDIWYIGNGYPAVGSEQRPGRPAVVVSNQQNNRYGEVVEVI